MNGPLNPPLFVVQPALDGQPTVGWTDITLRDLFAAASLAGHRGTPDGFDATSDQLAEWAYQDADALLKERSE